VVFHGFEYSGGGGVIKLVCLETGEEREISPEKAKYIASEMHKAFVGKKKTTQLLGAIDARDQRNWSEALQSIYEMAEEQINYQSQLNHEATSVRRTRGRYTHLNRSKGKSND
jgi:hypothetical protein